MKLSKSLIIRQNCDYQNEHSPTRTLPVSNNSDNQKRPHFIRWRKEITNFIWARKKLRFKYKILCDAKERGGLQLPNLEIYYDTCCLTWIQEWIILQDKKLLALEGFNKTFGWHAYLMYGKEKSDTIFKHHYIRENMLSTWLNYSKHLPEKKNFMDYSRRSDLAGGKRKEPLPYKELMIIKDGQTTIKTGKELNYKYDCLSYLQIKDLFRKDLKKSGFREQLTEMEILLMGETIKIIYKVYKYCLNYTQQMNM